MNNSYKKIFAICVSLVIVQITYAQPAPPGPTGAPIDGLVGIILMAVAAIFGKKYFDRK